MGSSGRSNRQNWKHNRLRLKTKYTEVNLKANRMYSNRNYSKSQNPQVSSCCYGKQYDFRVFIANVFCSTHTIQMHWWTVVPSLSAPNCKRPHDRFALSEMKEDFQKCLDNNLRWAAVTAYSLFHTQLSLAIFDTAVC